MLDHATRTLHLPALGEGKHLQTECGLSLSDVTVGPRDIVDKVVSVPITDCVECWPP